MNTKDIQIQDIDVQQINFQDDYRKKIDSSDNYYDENFDLPRGIFIKNKNRFRLIDGYHRTMKAKSMNMEKIKGIVLFKIL